MKTLLLNAVITQKIDISEDLIILRVVPEEWTFPAFEPGQFAVLGLPGSAPRCERALEELKPSPPDKMLMRAYSIASSSVANEYLEFYIDLVASGALSPRLFALKAGDRCWLGNQVTGIFTLREVPSESEIILIATGTGLAPYMSMVRSELPRNPNRRIAVIHGARGSRDLGYRSELTTVDRLCSNFLYLPVISRPGEERVPWKGAVGYVQDVWTSKSFKTDHGLKVSPEETHVFLCGNPDMVLTMLSLLESEGFLEHKPKRPGQVHIERYW